MILLKNSAFLLFQINLISQQIWIIIRRIPLGKDKYLVQNYNSGYCITDLIFCIRIWLNMGTMILTKLYIKCIQNDLWLRSCWRVLGLRNRGISKYYWLCLNMKGPMMKFYASLMLCRIIFAVLPLRKGFNIPLICRLGFNNLELVICMRIL